MKKYLFCTIFPFIFICNIYSLETENIYKRIVNTINRTNSQINELYQSNRMFHFRVEEKDLINDKIYNNDIYFYKNNLNVQIFESKKLLYHYIYSEGKFYQIVNNKKKIIKDQKIINNSFFLFGGIFLTLKIFIKFLKQMIHIYAKRIRIIFQ
jgi:hypothetical protein